MKTLNAGSNEMIGPVATQPLLRKVLLVCGIAAAVLYIATTIFAAMIWEGFNPHRAIVINMM
jgi:hypothetical protein